MLFNSYSFLLFNDQPEFTLKIIPLQMVWKILEEYITTLKMFSW